MYLNPKMKLSQDEKEFIEKIKESNKKIHEAIFKTAIPIFSLLNKHKINWVLHAGSALGAFLYQDFIPWDDDMDIAIDWKDRKKLLKALKTELPNGMELQDVSTNKHYQYPFPKVVSKNYPLKTKEFGDSNKQNYIWIDFTYYTKSTNKKKDWRVTFFGKWMWLREAKVNWFVNIWLNIFKVLPQNLLCKKVYKGMNKQKDEGPYSQEAFPYSKKENDLAIDFSKRKKAIFCNQEVYVINNFEDFYANHFKCEIADLYKIPRKKITHKIELYF